MDKENLQVRGKHQEIYLVSSGFRDVPEEKWRTIIRIPVEPKALANS